MEDVGNKTAVAIRRMRRNLKMNKKEFAEFCGLNPISISKYEAGGYMQEQSAEKISKACGVPIEDFWEPIKRKSHREVIVKKYNIDETNMIEEYRTLSRWGKNRLKDYLREMVVLYPKLDGAEKRNENNN